MRTIEIDGSKWTETVDFFGALRTVLGACPSHGWGFDAFEDSVFNGGMLKVEPPFQVIVRNCPRIFREDVETMARGWAEQRQWRKDNCGEDVEASIALAP